MIDLHLGNLARARNAQSRSLSAENPAGTVGGGAQADPAGEGPARELGVGWKVRPCLSLAPGETATLMDHDGPAVIRHIWVTVHPNLYRNLVWRVYWDGQDEPSIETPLGDFFCNAWNARQDVLGLPINVNPEGGMNCYFPMPFRRHCRITVTNDGPDVAGGVFYTINYTLEPVAEDALYLHAQWRRENPTAYQREYTILEGVKGRGHYVGTFMAWQQNNKGWWGEGEIKMYLDGDDPHPTICGTGTEDYFGGAWGFGKRSFSAPYLGFIQVTGQSEDVGARFTLYRFHVPDPVYFQQDLRVTMQALGWRSEGRFLPLQDDLASVAYWYQTLPHAPFPPLPNLNAREVI